MPIDTGFTRFQAIQQAVLILLISCSFIFCIKLYKARSQFIQLKRQGLRMPPYHPLLGHLKIGSDILQNLPQDAHPIYMPDMIRRTLPDLGPIFYLDMWPFTRPILVVASPAAIHQFTQAHSLPKAMELRHFLKPLTDNQDLVSLEGQAWKLWRKIFSPGFNANHLIHLVPRIIEEVSTFGEILRERAQADALFPLEDITVNMTMDTIGRVVLGTHFNAQRSKSPFVSALRRQIMWFDSGTEINPFRRWNPMRPLVHWYCSRVMDRFMENELERQFATHQRGLGDTKGTTNEKLKTIMDLALDSYLEEHSTSSADRAMDATFKKAAIHQMKIFILAGHDTTSASLCYVIYLLATHPQAMERARAEHDQVFGYGLTQTSANITTNPHALNSLPFTAAVIKEALRLFTPSTSLRDGEPGFSISVDGHQYPTEGFAVWSQHPALHREPLYWPQPDEFIPERWLVPEDDPMHPIKGAWRPFEFGPRNCIGQELAMLEMKIALVLMIREFDISICYEEWDRIHGTKGPKTVNGERAYQALKGTTRPADGMPCRVSIASR